MYSSYNWTSAAIFTESPIITDRSSSSDWYFGNCAITETIYIPAAYCFACHISKYNKHGNLHNIKSVKFTSLFNSLRALEKICKKFLSQKGNCLCVIQIPYVYFKYKIITFYPEDV